MAVALEQDLLLEAFETCCGAGRSVMDMRDFTVLCKEARLLDKKFGLTLTDVQLIFTKVVKQKDKRHMAIDELAEALELAAQRRGLELRLVRRAVLEAADLRLSRSQASLRGGLEASDGTDVPACLQWCLWRPELEDGLKDVHAAKPQDTDSDAGTSVTQRRSDGSTRSKDAAECGNRGRGGGGAVPPPLEMRMSSPSPDRIRRGRCLSKDFTTPQSTRRQASPQGPWSEFKAGSRQASPGSERKPPRAPATTGQKLEGRGGAGADGGPTVWGKRYSKGRLARTLSFGNSPNSTPTKGCGSMAVFRRPATNLVEEAFRAYCQDNEGVDLAGFRRLCKSLAGELSEEDVEKLFESTVANNGDQQSLMDIQQFRQTLSTLGGMGALATLRSDSPSASSRPKAHQTSQDSKDASAVAARQQEERQQQLRALPTPMRAHSNKGYVKTGAPSAEPLHLVQHLPASGGAGDFVYTFTRSATATMLNGTCSTTVTPSSSTGVGGAADAAGQPIMPAMRHCQSPRPPGCTRAAAAAAIAAAQQAAASAVPAAVPRMAPLAVSSIAQPAVALGTACGAPGRASSPRRAGPVVPPLCIQSIQSPRQSASTPRQSPSPRQQPPLQVHMQQLKQRHPSPLPEPSLGLTHCPVAVATTLSSPATSPRGTASASVLTNVVSAPVMGKASPSPARRVFRNGGA
eukprot:TRINITY_DN9247_c0_g1_i3.p1 TRINITY_DN9247_c0_g1~~TRINITY_DN9247_c0_g1_i3.p1  ORF type:complete len:688 (-),score=125.87 TRINITY_DN9247_c0_g1_i3:602-2665(-)